MTRRSSFVVRRSSFVVRRTMLDRSDILREMGAGIWATVVGAAIRFAPDHVLTLPLSSPLRLPQLA